MGLGGLNRVLLTASDLKHDGTAHLVSDDIRARHIRNVLSHGNDRCTLRVAVEDNYLHDEADCQVHADGSCTLHMAHSGRRSSDAQRNVTLLLAMQRPKATARIIQAAASVGVRRIVLIHGEKTERTYWQSRLVRAPCTASESVPTQADISDLAHIRRLLIEGVQQNAHDTTLPQVLVDRRALSEVAESYGGAQYTMMVAHPRGAVGKATRGSVVAAVARGAAEVVLAIGSEGGWSDEEVDELGRLGFETVQLGERVLRSETAVVVALALVHEGLRWRRERWTLRERDGVGGAQ